VKSKKIKKTNSGVAIDNKGIIFARSNHKFIVVAFRSVGRRKFGIMAR